MESLDKLQLAISMVEEARSVPLSASCVVHRGELLGILDEVKLSLPSDLDAASKVLTDRDSIIEEGRISAEQLVAMAREEAARLVEQTEIVIAARAEAERILSEAHQSAQEQRDEVDSYIDSRLATLEVILTKTMDAVVKGRERIAGASEKDVLSQLADE
ncbi:MAG: ATP synthase subunit B/B' [Candidatus Nanopelagicaceae bacterium]|jgi:F0F1-type ATP synthase membrane subunit b/b'